MEKLSYTGGNHERCLINCFQTKSSWLEISEKMVNIYSTDWTIFVRVFGRKLTNHLYLSSGSYAGSSYKCEVKVKRQILEFRGIRVMLDNVIAEYFGVETGALKRAIKRNIKKFPETFCFQLTDDELFHKIFLH